MPHSRQRLGALGERLAAAHLEREGYRILEANYRCPQGEIDLVAQEGEYLVFLEVRTRRGRNFGTPEESFTKAKAERLAVLAESYLESHGGLSSLWRIDLVAVELSSRGVLSRIEVIKNVVS